MVKIIDEANKQLCVENMSFPFEVGTFNLKKEEEKEIEFVSNICILIPIKGKVNIQVCKGEIALKDKYVINKEEVAFINSFSKIKITAELDTSINCIIFNPVMVYGYQNSLIQTKYVFPIVKSDKKVFIFTKQEEEKDITDKMVKTFQSIYCQSSNQKDEYELAVKMLLIKLWYLVYKSLSNKRDVNKNQIKKNSKISQSICFIHDHFGENITLDDIAKECELSKSELCKLFKKYVGQSPMQYLMKYRISSSCYFLLYTSDNIGTVSNKIGLEDSNYFAISFKRIMGCTPSEYRKSSFVNETRQDEQLDFISESNIF